MTLDEAFTQLSLDRSATPDEARRAYLRQLKVTKPEVDPEGFQRVREAYERVTQALTRPRTAPGETPVAPARPQVSSEVLEAFEKAAAIEEPGEWAAMNAAFELAARNLQPVMPPVLECVETGLCLLANDDLPSSQALYATFRKWLQTMPSEAAVFDGPHVVRWSLWQELLQMPDHAPRSVWLAITRAVLDEDLRYAIPKLTAFEKREPKRAAQAAAWWRDQAPTLGPRLASMHERLVKNREEAATSRAARFQKIARETAAQRKNAKPSAAKSPAGRQESLRYLAVGIALLAAMAQSWGRSGCLARPDFGHPGAAGSPSNRH